jgi:hypothetical protein
MVSDWEVGYWAAVLEIDNVKLAEKLDLATIVLRRLLRESNFPPELTRERERMEDALATLDVIRRRELNSAA